MIAVEGCDPSGTIKAFLTGPDATSAFPLCLMTITKRFASDGQPQGKQAYALICKALLQHFHGA